VTQPAPRWSEAQWELRLAHMPARPVASPSPLLRRQKNVAAQHTNYIVRAENNLFYGLTPSNTGGRRARSLSKRDGWVPAKTLCMFLDYPFHCAGSVRGAAGRCTPVFNIYSLEAPHCNILKKSPSLAEAHHGEVGRNTRASPWPGRPDLPTAPPTPTPQIFGPAGPYFGKLHR
jgi:hypothetical protein